MRRMNAVQVRRMRSLVRRMCANYDCGNCLLLDGGEPCVCPQIISKSVLCRYFQSAVLPADQELCAALAAPPPHWKRCPLCGALFPGRSNRAVYCGHCAQKEARRKTRERVRRYRGRM
ncbi:MAG: conjugal transfer protein [Oscillospiraceae bacterium]|nr:cysteine-rich VLP domain-containing protein [uncultured Oscillibacter sp.]MCI9581964.1 conjugal transfer protein [Oscillospiraceae bacterium]